MTACQREKEVETPLSKMELIEKYGIEYLLEHPELLPPVTIEYTTEEEYNRVMKEHGLPVYTEAGLEEKFGLGKRLNRGDCLSDCTIVQLVKIYGDWDQTVGEPGVLNVADIIQFKKFVENNKPNSTADYVVGPFPDDRPYNYSTPFTVPQHPLGPFAGIGGIARFSYYRDCHLAQLLDPYDSIVFKDVILGKITCP